MKEQRTCVNCGTAYKREASMTFDQGQCDDCITAWAKDRAVQHADATITAERPEPAAIREALRIHKVWSKP